MTNQIHESKNFSEKIANHKEEIYLQCMKPAKQNRYTGLVTDKDLALSDSINYYINYHFTVTDSEIKNDKLQINKAYLGIAFRLDMDETATDLLEEKKYLIGEIRKNDKLGKRIPNYVGKDNLSYTDLKNKFQSLFDLLNKIPSVLLTTLKDQIGVNNDKQILVSTHNVKVVPYNQMHMYQNI